MAWNAIEEGVIYSTSIHSFVTFPEKDVAYFILVTAYVWKREQTPNHSKGLIKLVWL
jgi:hypothetical protein